MNVLPAVIDEIIQQQPYLRWCHTPDKSIEVRFADTKGSVRQENDRLYITRYATVSSSLPLWFDSAHQDPMWSSVAVATVSLFDTDFLVKILRVTKEMFNILPAIREQIDKSHPTVFWKQINENCIETTSEPKVTITYDPVDNTITLSSYYIGDTTDIKFNSYKLTTTVDLLDHNFLEAILNAFAYHRVP